MKRRFYIFASLIVCLVLILPVCTYAKTFDLSDTEISVRIDDTTWYVFTRDNIKNNPELDELGLTYEAIYDILYDNLAYMDAVLFYDDGDYVELFIRKKALDSGIANLSNYDDKQVLALAKEIAQKQNAETYSVYESQYKFAKLEYFDSNHNYYICEYVTVANKDNYTLTFQSPSQFTDWEYEEIEKIVDSVQFDIDTTLKEELPTSGSHYVIIKTIIGAVGGGLVGAIIAIISKKRRKRSQTEDISSVSSPEIN